MATQAPRQTQIDPRKQNEFDDWPTWKLLLLIGGLVAGLVLSMIVVREGVWAVMNYILDKWGIVPMLIVGGFGFGWYKYQQRSPGRRK